MPSITLDGKTLNFTPGESILEIANRAGVEIPTLCKCDALEPLSSCLVCLVQLEPSGKMVPACSTIATDKMEVRSECEAVLELRRRAISLILTDHQGDCLAPCTTVCPVELDVPTMFAALASGDNDAAIRTLYEQVALPGVLAYLCPAPCEKACRRTDAPLNICKMKEYVADSQSTEKIAAVLQKDTETADALREKIVAVVGAGPSGLAAALHLRVAGCTVVLLEQSNTAAPRLRADSELPSEVLDRDIQLIKQLGVELRLGCKVGEAVSLDALRRDFDAVLLAAGDGAHEALQIPESSELFLAGQMQAGKRALVGWSVQDGKIEAEAIVHFLLTGERRELEKPFTTRMKKLSDEQVRALFPAGFKEAAPRQEISTTISPEVAQREATRCLDCSCNKLDTCQLRYWAAKLKVPPPRMVPLPERSLQLDTSHPQLSCEPGKCIACGICVGLTEQAEEPVGLSLNLRGYEVRVAPPLGASMAEAVTSSLDAVTEACPTAALTKKDS